MGWNLDGLLAEYDVPGVQVAVLAGGEIRDEAAVETYSVAGTATTTSRRPARPGTTRRRGSGNGSRRPVAGVGPGRAMIVG